jgi:hypothetical protein
MIGNFLLWLEQLIKYWIKPSTPVLVSGVLSDLSRSRIDLVVENALLRQQLIVLKRQVKRSQLTDRDRFRLIFLSHFTKFWKQSLHIVQPETLLRWHRELFRIYWRQKSQGKPKISPETISLIQKIAGESLMGSRTDTRRTAETGDRSEQTDHPEVHAEREGRALIESNLGDLPEGQSWRHLGL